MVQNKGLKHRLKYLLPVSVKKTLKYILNSFQDFISFITGKKNEYPPKRLNFVGSSEFKKVGDEFVKYFINLGHLNKTDTVLDIGCGIGRMAIPLTKHLNNKGELYGFDIDKRGIKWCHKNLTKKYPNFHFEYVDLYNKYYNKKGKIKAENFKFPYENNKFDFIFATSVFTHMLPNEVEQYLKEIKRVLKKGGKAFLTFFSIDKTAEKNMENGKSYCDFKYPYKGKFCFYSHKNVPEAETGYNEEWIINQYEKMGIDKNLKIYRGKWSGRKEFLSYQDIFISQKQ